MGRKPSLLPLTSSPLAIPHSKSPTLTSFYKRGGRKLYACMPEARRVGGRDYKRREEVTGRREGLQEEERGSEWKDRWREGL